MRPQVRNALLVGGVVALGSYIGWRWWSHQQERRALFDSGEVKELTDLWTAVDGCRCYARVRASGVSPYPPVILVHGFGISGSYFVPTAERLSREFDVYVPDLPGHGFSDAPTWPLDVRGYARALAHWLDAMGLDQVILVGNSMGCQIAVELAIRNPQRVERLVLIGPTMDRSARSLPRVLPRFLAGGLHERASLNAVLTKDYSRMGTRLGAEYEAMINHRIETRLPHVTQPTLFIRGEKDPIAPAAWVAELVAATPDARTAEIPGWGHAVNYSAAEELVQLMTPFLRAGRYQLASSTADATAHVAF